MTLAVLRSWARHLRQGLQGRWLSLVLIVEHPPIRE